jgi:hypothetical protein
MAFLGVGSKSPVVLAEPDGGFSVLWQSWDRDAGQYKTYTQRYAADGDAVGSATVVDPTIQLSDDVYASSVSYDADGDFVLTWSRYIYGDTPDEYGYTWGDTDIFAQRYDASGNPVGNEFQVNSTTLDWQDNPDVAVDADGDFVVVWQSYSYGDTPDENGYTWGDTDIFAQRYDANGNPIGGEFQVNTTAEDWQENADVAMDADGDFVVVWQSYSYGDTPDENGYTWGDTDIFAQRYDANGNPIGGEFQVNTTAEDWQENADVAMDADGDFVVVWQGYTEGTTPDEYGYTWGDTDIFAQRYDANGNPIGDEFLVNTTLGGDQSNASVTFDANGGFVVTWETYSWSDEEITPGIYGQRYDSQGNAVGDEFLVFAFPDRGDVIFDWNWCGTGSWVIDDWVMLDWRSLLDGESLPTGVFDIQFASAGGITPRGGSQVGDVMIGRKKDDSFKGKEGNDFLHGRAGSDSLRGGAGSDGLRGGGGDDIMRGGAGEDFLDGGCGDDDVIGNSGRDLLFGGRGKNHLEGNGGKDVFVVETKSLLNIVDDFEVGRDRLGLSHGLQFGDLDISQHGQHSFISVDGDRLMKVLNVDADSLRRRDFVVV